MSQSNKKYPPPFDVLMERTDYGDMHRIIVQCMMSAGMLDAKGVKTVFTGALKYCGHEIDEKETIPMDFIAKTLREINEKINQYDLAIKSVTCEITCKKYYVFIISVEKPIMKMQKVYSPFEIELFQKIMDRILRKYKNFAVSMVECINITHEIEGHGHVSLKTSESFIDKMLILQYFTKLFRKNKKNTEYDITLGPRSIREMEPILKDVYQDVLVDCIFCSQIMLHGYVCPTCDSPIHKACYTRCTKHSPVCRNEDCKADWTPESVMKQRENVDGDEPQSEATVSKKSKKVAKAFADSISDDSSETENEDGMPRLEPMQIDHHINDDSNSSDGSTESESTNSS